MIDPFFERAPTKWNIADFTRVFLENSPDQQPTFNSLTSVWTNSIDAIYRDSAQTKHRRDKAKSLREQWDTDRHKKVSQHKLAKKAYTNFEKARPQSTIIGLINHGHIAGSVQTLCTEASAEVTRDFASAEDAQDETRKKRALNEQDATDSSSADSEQDKLRKKRKKKKKQKERNASIDEDSKYQFLACFETMYNSMLAGKKWILGSGRAVEDIIYSYASVLDRQIVAHLFILDPEDSSLEKLFTKPEWLEIVSHLEARHKAVRAIPTPECLDWITNEVTTTKQLREILYNSKLQQGLNEEWVYDVYRQFLFLLEHPDKPLTRNNCENWLEIFVIGPLVHRCLMSVEGIMFRCKEAPSVATRRINNKNRTETGEGNYLLPGPRLDGIFRLISPDFEFGACEVGKDDKGPEDTKRIDDFRKLVVTLSHMLLRLHRELDVTCVEELQVVGFMCSGLTLQPLRMYSPNGYVCLLERDRTLRIPANAMRLRDIAPLLKSIWLLKKTMSDSVALVLGSDAKSTQ